MADIDIYKAKLPQDDTNLYRFRDGVIEPLVDTSYEETDYANPLTFETLQAQTAKNTKIKINPIQDLHGYSKPWVGGAGKNKLPLTVDGVKTLNNAGTWNGNTFTPTGQNITYTIMTDDDNNVIGIKINGTNGNTTTTFSLAVYDFGENNFNTYNQPSASYIASSGYNDDSASSYGIQYQASITATYIRIAANYSFSNKVFYPMIRLSTETDATFQPYTNIASISGHDQIDILGCGKNLLSRIENGTWQASTQSKAESLNRARSANIIRVKPSTKYTFNVVGTNKTIHGIYCTYSGIGTDTLITNSSWQGFPITFTTEANAQYVTLTFRTSDSSDNPEYYISNPQLELGSTATDYEPYTESNNLSIDLPSTVYGGVLDLESGELVVDKGIVDMGTMNWIYWTYQGYGGLFYSGSLNSLAKVTNDTIPISSHYNGETNAIDNTAAFNKGNGTCCYRYPTFDRFYVRDDRYDNEQTFKTAISGYQLVYELSTPFTLYISPERLKLLKAQNTITTSQYTQVKVTYRNGVFATLGELTNAVSTLSELINNNTEDISDITDKLDGISEGATKTGVSSVNGHIEIDDVDTTVYDDTAVQNAIENIEDELSTDSATIEGNPLNFSTLSAQNAESTIIDLEPIQDLHGYDKPWVGGAGKNKLPLVLADIKTENTSGTWNGNVFTHNNGASFEVLLDNDNNIIGFKLGGNATGNCNLRLTKTQNWGLGGKLLSGVNLSQSIYLGVYDDTLGIGITSAGGDTVIPTEYTNYRAYLRVNQGISPNVTVYPMVRNSGETNSFAPYTNECSISGRTEIGILGCGKNLATASIYKEGYVLNADGTETSSSDYCISDTIRIESDNTYYLSAERKSGGTDIIRVGYYDDKMTFISRITALNQIITTPNNASYIRLSYCNKPNSASYIFNIQLELGNQSTPYEPYTKSTDLTISLGQTVYGGTLDVENGVLVVDKGYKLFDGTETWTILNYGHVATQISNMKSGTNQDGICSILETGNSSGQMQFGSGSNFIYIMNASGVYEIDTNEKAQTFTNGMQICYPLATPITIQLTPNEISLLEGVNNISTTGDKITLTYRNGKMATLSDLLDLEKKLTDEEPYGFIEHMSILDPAQRIEYIGKNKNYKPVTVNLSGDHLANYNEWYDFFVLKENEPYMIKSDGTVDYALDPNDYTKKFDGSASDITDTSYTGGAFAWIPKTYKREFVVGDDRYVYISTKKLSDEYEAIGFIDENGLEHDGVWIPMFYGTEITQDNTVKIMSLATGTPSQLRDTATQKTYIENFSSKAKFFGGPIVNVLADLLIMLGKNSDIQAVFGTGNMSGGNGAQYMKDNACINGGAFYGSTTNTALNKAFHSLVLLTQNQYQRDPYTLCYKGEFWVSPYYKYDLTGDSYVKTGVYVTPPSSNNWVYPNKSVSVPHWGAIPVGPYSGSTTTGWADGQYTRADQLTDATIRVGLRFAVCADGRAGGPRCLYLRNAAGSTAWNFGASALLLSEGKSK